jgi:hypothetical protein
MFIKSKHLGTAATHEFEMSHNEMHRHMGKSPLADKIVKSRLLWVYRMWLEWGELRNENKISGAEITLATPKRRLEDNINIDLKEREHENGR